jgi:hypothetical protein
LDKLREIFGADAGLYITVEKFGVSYRLIDSVVEASASAKLVDLRSGKGLWQGKAYASTGQNDSSGGLVGMLVNAAVKQIVNSLSDSSYKVGRMATYQLLSTGSGRNGLLYGPYHPGFGTD